MRLPADAYAELATLTSVTRLTLACSDKLPTCLGSMTWLRALQLSESAYNRLGTPSYSEEELEAALEPLTGLNSLVSTGAACGTVWRCMPCRRMVGPCGGGRPAAGIRGLLFDELLVLLAHNLHSA